MTSELVPDPGFDDAAKWATADVIAGAAVVSAGALTCTNYQGRVISVPEVAAVIGRSYNYEIVIASTDAAGSQAVQFGDASLWSGASGAGTFRGTITATAVDAINIAIASNPGNLVINRISIVMAHVRQQIREAVAVIVTGLTTTSTRVFQSRVYDVQEGELPCLLVYTKDESIGSEQGTLIATQRSLELIIEGKAKANATLDDTLDDIAKEVEIVVAADITIGNLAHSIFLDSTSIELSGDGDQPIGSISLNYLVNYMTPFGDPETVA